MKSHFDLTDAEFEKSIEEATLSPYYFNHEAHLRLSYLILRRLGLKKGTKQLQSVLYKYVTAKGARGKYDREFTVKAVKVVYCYMNQLESPTFKDFLRQTQDLQKNFGEIVRNFDSCDNMQKRLQVEMRESFALAS